MTLAALDSAARDAGLALHGAFHPADGDGAPEGARTLVLLGPDEPAFWAIFSASPEYGDGEADPLERWSKRVIGALAEALGGSAVFPYDGPPFAPFLRWARATGRCWPSPTGLLVHDSAGLMVSFRGALALPDRLDLDPVGLSPCDTCPAPCASACPVGALRAEAPYDVAACKRHFLRPEGRDCLSRGCLVRRACPVSEGFDRHPEQAAFHMAAFVKD